MSQGGRDIIVQWKYFILHKQVDLEDIQEKAFYKREYEFKVASADI